MLKIIIARMPESLHRGFSIGRFVLIHLICLGAIWTGLNAGDLLLCAALYAIRMFAVTGGYHRYFSHRTFRTGRTFQFLLAFLAQSSGQKGVLWWAGHHRRHHRYSDLDNDTHSPKRGFWWAHVGWFLVKETRDTPEDHVSDFIKYPELRWLNEHPYTPLIILGLICLTFGGWSGVVVGLFWSTVACYHATFTINSLSHIWGSRRYETQDTSRNNLFLALLTFGEGWHNNHHHYPASANQGFFWWEVDITFYVLLVLEKLGIVWDVRRTPVHVIEGRHKNGR